MGTGMPGDSEKTIEQLKNPSKNHGKLTWLRHRLDSQSGLIDMMLLEGQNTVEEMAAKLKGVYPDREFDSLCKRIRDHIEHLQKGDARDLALHKNDNHVPHYLNLTEINGRWSFSETQDVFPGKLSTRPKDKAAPSALFINGIYEGVLNEILEAQKTRGGGNSFLQPYKGVLIRMLKRQIPTDKNPIRLYISTTKNLSQICYTADIVGWEDKRQLSDSRRSEISQFLHKYQPCEAGYFDEFDKEKEWAINLITIRRLAELETLHSTNLLRKVSDGLPLKKRTRAGGWSEVYEIGDLIAFQVETQEQLELDLESGVAKSSKLSDQILSERLEASSNKPEKVQILSTGYRRNPYVIDAVLRRANGFCEKCGKPAPFFRRSDGSPYLEVHHWKSLSEEGDDTVSNAAALCPNCHREVHHGLATK